MTGKEKLLYALKTKGVKYIFGYTGGTIMPVFDEMDKMKYFQFIMSRHEQGAAFMAQGLSRASLSTDNPQLGVCMATSGPGAMNLTTGVADAHMDSVPMLVVTGQVATGVIATDHLQEAPCSAATGAELIVHQVGVVRQDAARLLRQAYAGLRNMNEDPHHDRGIFEQHFLGTEIHAA